MRTFNHNQEPSTIRGEAQLALAIFEWIEAWYNPRRRHSSIADLAPVDHEHVHAPLDEEQAA